MNKGYSSSREQRLMETLGAITDYKEKNNGISPTVRELCSMVGVSSTSTMHGYIHTLIDRGLIGNSVNMPRTFVVNDARKGR